MEDQSWDFWDPFEAPARVIGVTHARDIPNIPMEGTVTAATAAARGNVLDLLPHLMSLFE